MKTAKEKVLERYPDAVAVEGCGLGYWWIKVTEGVGPVRIGCKQPSEQLAWDSAAATMATEPKEVTLTELSALRVKAIRSQDLPVRWEQGTDGAFRVYVGGKMVFESTVGEHMIAKLRELATQKPPELPDMIPVMLPVEFLANFSGTAWATRLYRNAADSFREALAKARAAKPEPPVSQPIQWYDETDQQDNTWWSATSPYAEGFMWRLKPRYENNRLEWHAEHDSELGGDGEFWLTIEEAKAAVQAAHDAILREHGTETT